MITEPTWMIHQVFDEHSADYHTHGLNKYNSLELEINLPIEKELAMYILNEIGLEMANKKRELKDGDIIEEIVNVKLAVVKTRGVRSDAHKGEESVFRIILPDENLKFPWDEGCDAVFKKQIESNKGRD